MSYVRDNGYFYVQDVHICRITIQHSKTPMSSMSELIPTLFGVYAY